MFDFDPSELNAAYTPSQDFTCDNCRKPESVVGSLRCIIGAGVDLQLCKNCYAKLKLAKKMENT